MAAADGRTWELMALYTIIGGDGNQYGPVSEEQLRLWIAQGRAGRQTRARPEGAADWKPLGEFAEFAGAFPASSPALPPPLPQAAAAGGKTSGLAIASLVLGGLGLPSCGLTALVGLILGIVALVKINRSQGAIGGSGLAIAGICVSGTLLLVGLPIQAALLLPAVARAKSKAQSVKCVSNLRQVGVSGLRWAEQHGGRLPPDFQSMTNELATPIILLCPRRNPSPRWTSFMDFDFAVVDYEIVSPGMSAEDREKVFVLCPHHGHVVQGDGTVVRGDAPDGRRAPPGR
jgi:hypothetical protein